MLGVKHDYDEAGELTKAVEYGNEVRYKKYKDGKWKSLTVYEYRAFAVPVK